MIYKNYINNLLFCFILLLPVILISCSNTRTGEQQSIEKETEFDQLSDSLDVWTDKYTPVGVEVLIIRDGEMVFHEAYGWKNMEAGLAMDTNSIFRVASMTKPITATGILILKDRDKLKLTDRVSEYIPEFAEVANDSITIEHLLRHTSGYGEYQIWKDYGEELRILPGLESVIEEIAKHQPAQSPGEEEYSSINTILLSQIIKVVSGEAPEDFLMDYVINPLGMNNTYLLDEPDAEWFSKIPVTYELNRKVPKPYWIPGKDLSMYPFFRGSTGASTTARDYARFLQMWLNGGELDGVRIVEKKTVEEALENNGKSFGLHWMVPVGPDNGDLFGHTGWYGTSGAAYRKDNTIVLYLTQTYNAPNIRAFNKWLAKSEVLKHKGPFDLQMELPSLPDQPVPSYLERFAGTYEGFSADSIPYTAELRVEDEHLWSNISGNDESWTDELIFVDDDVYAPGLIKGYKPIAISPKVFYDFRDYNNFSLKVLNEEQFVFSREEKVDSLKEKE